jgi:hypothetical protein
METYPFLFIRPMLKKVLFFIVIASSSLQVFSQSDPNFIPVGTNLQRRPSEWLEQKGLNENYFLKPNDPNSLLRLDGAQSRGSNYNALWLTFAAHPNVPLYKGGSVSSGVIGTLVPMVQYVVVRRNGGTYRDGFVELMEYNFGSLDFKDDGIRTLHRLRRLGWAKASDLVLWDYSLKDESGFNIKFLAISDLSTPGQLSKAEAKDKKDEMYFYDSPELTKRNGQSVPMLSFLFLYKIEKNKKGEKVYLIGRKEYISGDPEEVILGWADEALLKRWPGRRALEPNTEKKAAEERSSIKYQYQLKFLGALDKTIPFPDPKDVRWPAERRRIIEMSELKRGELNSSPNTEVAFIHNPTKQWGDQSVEDEKKLRTLNETIRLLRKIKLVLVVDGSDATMKYKEQIPKAFETLKNKMELGANNNFQYSFGAVVYRDNVVAGAPPIEEIQFTDDASSFISSLEKINFSNKDKRQGDQNLLEGLDRAVGFFQGSQRTVADKAAQHFILVLGAGGDQSVNVEKKIDKIAQKLRDNNVSILSNQFYNDEDDIGYSMFTTQIQEVMRKAIQGIQGKEKVDFKKKTSNVFAVNYPEESPLAAQTFSADPGILPTEQAFLNSIDVAFSNIQKNISQLIIDFNNQAEGLAVTSAGLERICKENPGLCPSFNADDKLDLMIKGTIDLADSRLTNSPYARSILFTSNELANFTKFLEDVAHSNESGDKLREQVYKAVQEFIRVSMGKKESNNKQVMDFLEKYNGTQLIEKFVGYTPKNEFLKRLNRLDDIKVKSSIGDIIAFQVSIRNVLKYLQGKAFLDSSEFESSESRFYWCLVSELL